MKDVHYISIIIILIVSNIFWCSNFVNVLNENKELKRVCIEQSNLIDTAINAIQENIDLLESLEKED
jgi:hypothetical protein